jgi:dolichol-phosphate mannosyltransferase
VGTERISIIIPCLNDAANLERLLPRLRRAVEPLDERTEIIVVDGGSTDDTRGVAEREGVRVVVQQRHGYGSALKAGFAVCGGDYIVTVDPDLSHNPAFIPEMILRRHEADVLIASRYIRRGFAWMPLARRILSRALNWLVATVLGLPLRDLSSGFRLYRKTAIASIAMESDDYALLLEIAVRLYSAGYRIIEIPFHYRQHRWGHVRARPMRLALDYLRTLWATWRLRNSIDSSDYDERAFDSRMPLQRYWQRKRYRIIVSMVGDALSVLDIGCGSSKIIDALPQSVVLDIQLGKLRYKKTVAQKSVCASVLALPFRDRSFPTIIFSEVIEHLPKDRRILDECVRVLQPGGVLVLGTPDYGRWQWRVIEWLYARLHPSGYADEHVAHFTRAEVYEEMEQRGLTVEKCDYILGAEMIVKARLKA